MNRVSEQLTTGCMNCRNAYRLTALQKSDTALGLPSSQDPCSLTPRCFESDDKTSIKWMTILGLV
jgi:hypothetical protein